MASSCIEGFASIGIYLGSLKTFTCPFELSTVEHQSPPPTLPDTSPVLYTITARTAVADADTYVELLERCYDPFMVQNGSALQDRRRTIDQGYLGAEVHSTWQIDSLSSYSDFRGKTISPDITMG